MKNNFINKLSEKQLDFLNKNIDNFDEKETDEIAEYLMDYFQRECIIDDKITKEGVFVESILDVLGEI